MAQQLIVITLAPQPGIKRYSAGGCKRASLDSVDAVDGVIVRLLGGGWRLVSVDQHAMYFACELMETISAAPQPQSRPQAHAPAQPPRVDPPARPAQSKTVTDKLHKNDPNQLKKGETFEYQVVPITYDKKAVQPIYVRPIPDLVGEKEIPRPAHVKPEPEKIDIDEWLRMQSENNR